MKIVMSRMVNLFLHEYLRLGSFLAINKQFSHFVLRNVFEVIQLFVLLIFALFSFLETLFVQSYPQNLHRLKPRTI